MGMFDFLKKSGGNKELEEALRKLQMNCENNYKDAAQANFREFCGLLQELKDKGKLSAKQLEYYDHKLEEYKEKMKKFTHKDQTPYWQ
ncbi:MAG: hypothetical protein IJ291_00495 [Lachnospiraceae bacterium]|nr:hypothetical protein [Lachnospiraceae bacterium]